MTRSAGIQLDDERDEPIGPGGPPKRMETGSVVLSATVVFFGNLVARGLGFLFPVLVARATGRADFAAVYFFITTGFTAGELVLAGYPTAMTRSLARPGRRTDLVASAVVAGLPLLAAAVVLGEALAAGADLMSFLITMVIVGLSVDAYYFGILRGLRRFGLLVAYRISANLAQLVLLGLAVSMEMASVPVLVGIYAAVYLVPIVIIELIIGPARELVRRGPGEARISRAAVAELTRFAVPALVSGTAYAAILGLDVFFVRAFAPAQLADYGAARALAMPMTLVSFAIGTIVLPHAAGLGEPARRALLLRAVGGTVALAIVGVAAYAVLGRMVVDTVFPAAYAGAVELLPALALVVGLLGIYSVLSQWWMGTGRPTVPAFCLVTGAVTAALAHTVLTRQLGAVGAIGATGIGAAVAMLLLGAFTVRHPDFGSGIAPEVAASDPGGAGVA